jgi:hypothetical protein
MSGDQSYDDLRGERDRLREAVEANRASQLANLQALTEERDQYRGLWTEAQWMLDAWTRLIDRVEAENRRLRSALQASAGGQPTPEPPADGASETPSSGAPPRWRVAGYLDRAGVIHRLVDEDDDPEPDWQPLFAMDERGDGWRGTSFAERIIAEQEEGDTDE